MNSEELKNLQAPLKNKYRADPGSALMTLTAKGEIGDSISCIVKTGRAPVTAGLHPATGGDGLLACSADLLLQALVTCAGVTLSAVATSMGIELISGHVIAEGILDFRGTLGVSKDVAVGFQSITLTFKLRSNEREEKINTLIRLTERYCVVYQTLRTPATIQTIISALP